MASAGEEASELISTLQIDEKNLIAPSHLSSPTLEQQDEATIQLVNVSSRPTVVLLIGMAGAGKTSLTTRLTANLMESGRPPYIINLDPACLDPPYPVNIDIRETIDYKAIMKQYHLGPNGAIVTSLNLFATKFDQIIRILLSKPNLTSKDLVLIDTPGQIEVFMWSASGQIILQSLAAKFPTMILYVADLTTNVSPITFVSNMSYACSILYKSKLPLVVIFNKCDRRIKQAPGMAEGAELGLDEENQDYYDPAEIPATSYAETWMSDFEAFDSALNAASDSFATTLASSLSLALDEFYSKIDYVSVSAKTGHGLPKLFEAIGKAVIEYETVYQPMFQRQVEADKKKRAKKTSAKAALAELGKNMTRAVPTKKSKYGRERDAATAGAGSDGGDDGSSGLLFSAPATSATSQGFSLTMGMGLDDEEDDTSSDEEEDGNNDGMADEDDDIDDDNEADKESFRQFYNREMGKREHKATTNK